MDLLQTSLNAAVSETVHLGQLENIQCAKLLGLEIDKELPFYLLVDKLCKKLSQRIGSLRKLDIVSKVSIGFSFIMLLLDQ